MACEFVCPDCKGDGTRCRCHEKRKYPYVPTVEPDYIQDGKAIEGKTFGEALEHMGRKYFKK